MTIRFGLFPLLRRLLRDEDGAYLLYMSLALPAFIGVSGLATEAALIFYTERVGGSIPSPPTTQVVEPRYFFSFLLSHRNQVRWSHEAAFPAPRLHINDAPRR